MGNHWVLAALISLCFCLAALGRFTKEQSLNAARTTLLVAYSFAAFAKLNWDFIDPAVSCVPLFQERAVSSWGLPGLSVVPSPALGVALAVMTIVIEGAIPLLVAFRPTRRWGVALAFAFHGALAFDYQQHFWDFSSVIFAGYLLFLDDNQLLWLRQKLAQLSQRFETESGRPISQPSPALVGVVCLAAGLGIGLLNILAPASSVRDLLSQLGHTAWAIYGIGMIVLVLSSLKAPVQQSSVRGAEPRRALPALLLVPAGLAFLNGLTPYLEIKTGFGWNMYSNLLTVAGKSNHMLIPATLDLTGAQRDLVTIVRSTDPELQRLHDQEYALPYSEFREYAHRFPNSAATYQWKGQTYQAARLGDSEAGREPVSWLGVKFFSFRAVDLQTKERCQANFSPAR